jgi:ADP-ribose pyrophosphatase YjhB (NUDIX family)
MRRELHEEIGVEAEVLDPVALAILEDRTVGTWEIVHRAILDVLPPAPPGWEHDGFAAVTPDSMPTPASAAAIAMAGLARDVLRAAGG